MTTNLLCFLRRSSFCLFFLWVCSFAYADHAPLPLELRPHHVQQTDSDAIRRRKERIKQIKQSTQESLQNANRERIANENRRAFRSIFYFVSILILLAQRWMKKYKNTLQEDTAEDDLSQNAPQKQYGCVEEVPVVDIGNLGMRSRWVLKMLFAVIIVATGVSSVVVCSKELLTCYNIWQPMIEQGFDPKTLLLKDLILNIVELLVGIAILVVGIVFFVRIMKQHQSTIEEDMEDNTEN